MAGKSTYRTKLCVLYKKGRCPRQNCPFAHGNSELRRYVDFPNSGRRNNPGNDLRDKLDRRLSLERRHSPRKEARGRGPYSGYDGSRTLEKRRDRELMENQELDDQSNYTRSLKVTSSIDDQAKDRKNIFSSSKSVVEEKLKEVQLDVNMLSHHKLHIGGLIEEKVQEADSLISRIQELEAQLDAEKEECKRISSSIKAFVTEYDRFSQAQDELKRSQARLQKFRNQLLSDVSGAEGNDADSNIKIVSDEENTGYHPKNEQSTPNEINSSLSKKRLHVNQDPVEESVADAMLRGGGKDKREAVRLNKHSRWSSDCFQLNSEKEAAVANNVHANDEPSSKEDRRKRRKHSASNASIDKGPGSGLVMPSTSMAAHANDELAEIEEVEIVETDATEAQGGSTLETKGLPFSVPPPPPIFRNTYSQYEGDNENVDVDGLEETIRVGTV